MTRKQYIRVLYKWHADMVDSYESVSRIDNIKRKKQRLELLHSFTDAQLHDLYMTTITDRASR
jgi:hypothetical protein